MSQRDASILAIINAVYREASARRKPPEATYRLQFNREFTFRDAATLVPYLHALGVSHVYASPYLKARPGSPHGYDVCDHNALNPELGGPEDYAAFVYALRAHGLGQILDFVPNHMSIAGDDNAWWNDVLENGPSSPYAGYFDIDWRPAKSELANRVLLPVLGEQYGQVLESGELKLAYRDGAFFLEYGGNRWPIDPQTTDIILTDRLDELQAILGQDSAELQELESIVTALEHLPRRTATALEKVEERQREKEIVKGRLARLASECPAILEAITRTLQQFSGRVGDPRSFDRLDALLDKQAYRLAHWRAASDEINYRRFFDINELAALCMEDRDVFESAHRLVLALLARGELTGLRIDHIDGLYSPVEYLQQLQRSYLRELGRHFYEEGQMGGAGEEPARPAWDEIFPAFAAYCEPWVKFGMAEEERGEHDEGRKLLASQRAERNRTEALGNPSRGRPTLYVVVEKILGPNEPLPKEWPVAGTTGYDFMNVLNRLFVDPAGLREIVKTYSRFLGQRLDFMEVAYRSKFLVLQASMSSELHMLAHRLNRISEQDRWSRDFTLNSLRHALREILVCFPVYRTYISSGRVSDRDRRFVQLAVARAKRQNPAIDSAVFDFIRETLLLEHPDRIDEPARNERELFVGRFQQVTSPVMAKGVEDTAFYVYFPLVSLNEVGGDPALGMSKREPAEPVMEFHEQNQERLAQWPGALLATSTHDNKRSEDVRARINVLSEIPHHWRTSLNRWARLNRRHRGEVDGLPAPSRNDEYLVYQTLAGIWPLQPPEASEREQLLDRVRAYMTKATREAKLRTSWTNPDEQYEQAMRDFVEAVLDDNPKNRFLDEFRLFQERVINCGLYNSLSQTLLKLTAPGVPDVYQGQEIWDFSLVDPDNRRPVDFELRRQMLAELQKEHDAGPERFHSLARHLCSCPRNPRTKLFVTWRILQHRREHAALFAKGDYTPLVAEGAKAEHVCAFARRLHGIHDGQKQPNDTAGYPEQDDVAVIIAPRLLAQLMDTADGEGDLSQPPVGAEVWQDTSLPISQIGSGTLFNVFTGSTFLTDRSDWLLSEVLSDFPVALLVKTS